MKKLFLTGVAVLFAAAAFAQEKGDMYVSGAFNISGGQDVSSIKAGDSTTKTERPSSLNFTVAPAFYYFVVDNLAVGAAVGYSLDRTFMGLDNDSKLFMRTNQVYISPGVIYYLRLADKFYYTPALDLSVGFGNVAEDVAVNTVEKQGLTTFGLGLSVLSFEFQPSEHVGISVSAGDFSYVLSRTKTSETAAGITVSGITTQHRAGFDLNYGASIGFKYYF